MVEAIEMADGVNWTMVGVKMGVFATTFYPQNPSKNLNPPPTGFNNVYCRNQWKGAKRGYFDLKILCWNGVNFWLFIPTIKYTFIKYTLTYTVHPITCSPFHQFTIPITYHFKNSFTLFVSPYILEQFTPTTISTF